MTIWISRDYSLYKFERLDLLCASIGPPCNKLWPFEFLESFRYSISSFSIYYAPELDPRLITYDHLNFSRAFVVQFRASRYIEKLEIEQRKLSRNLNGHHNLSHGSPIQAHTISRRSKSNHGRSREIQMVITFSTKVRFNCIIYRDTRN